MDEVDVSGPQLAEDDAIDVLDTITDMDDVSSLANVAANTTKAKLR